MKKLTFVMWLTVVLVCGAMALHASWAHNYIHGQGEPEGDSLIVKGASAFLLSYSDVLLVLNESELGKNGIAGPERSLGLVESALSRLTTSRQRYQDALVLLKLTERKKGMREKLKHFDYTGLVSARGLDDSAMQRVSAYLMAGDLAGLLRDAIHQLEELEGWLQYIRDNYSKSKSVEIDVLRPLFEGYSNFLRTGYYSSLVFSSIISDK